MDTPEILHRLTQRPFSNVPAGLALIVPEIDITGAVTIDPAHIGLFVDVVTPSISRLGYLGTIAVLVPKVVIPYWNAGLFRRIFAQFEPQKESEDFANAESSD